MMKYTLATLFVFLFTCYAHGQTNSSTTVTSIITLSESSIDLGYIGRGGAITGGWNQLPNLLTINYSGRDFAIGGWGKTANNWMGAALFINSDNGNVGIGTTTPDSKLTVLGNVHSREVKVSVSAGADFVFKEEYKLRPLEEVAAFIRSENHLPEIASAEEMKENGMELGQMNIKLLQKIEELTLYMIDMKKQLGNVERDNKVMKEEMIRLKGAQ